MSKHDTFKRNIKSMTGARSFKEAIQKWKVHEDVNLPREGKMVSCELCGTRFRKGAVIHHSESGSTVTIGGTCLEHVLLGRFKSKSEVARQKREMAVELGRRYADVVDPGAWRTWVIEHAVQRYPEQVVCLRTIGVVTQDQLTELIKFHDANRLYPRDSLLPHWEWLPKQVRNNLPKELTIQHARRIRSTVDRNVVFSNRIQDGFEYADQFFTAIDGCATVWEGLSEREKRIVAALLELSRRMRERYLEDLSELMTLKCGWKRVTFPLPPRSFVWHPKVGLGFAFDGAQEDAPWPAGPIPGPRADVGVFSRGAKHMWGLFDLTNWFQVDLASDRELRLVNEVVYGVEEPSWLLN